MSETPERLIDKLRKLEELVQRGIGGERDKARVLRDAICAKYGITPEQFIDQTTDAYIFHVESKIELRLLMNIAAWACQTTKIKNVKARNEVHLHLTQPQYIDIVECFQFYRGKLAEGLDDYCVGFIHQHKLFAPPSGEAEEQSAAIAEARWKRIALLMQAMPNDHWQNRKTLPERVPA